MRRRDIFRTMVAGMGALAALRPARADAGMAKVVYHLSDFEKAGFVLGNIRNHYEGTDGKTTIALVVHGPALGAFTNKAASRIVVGDFGALRTRGLAAYACANTLQGMGLALSDVLPGFARADKGGVVKLAELQRDGYAYLRP
jgi:intracellular sulfur oxidation DsrE/DsrF family protein